MKSRVWLWLAFAVVLVAAVAVGWVAQMYRASRESGIRATLEAQMQQMEDNLAMLPGVDLKPIQTSFEDWTYPNGTPGPSGQVASGSIKSQAGLDFDFELGTEATWYTTDTFDAVAAHYEKVLARVIQGPRDFELKLNGSNFTYQNGVCATVVAQKTDDTDGSQNGNHLLLVLQARNCSMTLSVLQTPGNDQTSVTVVFSRLKSNRESSP